MAKSNNKKLDTRILLMCLSMGIITRFSTDHFLPSLPAIKDGLDVHCGLVQLSVSLYPLCIGLSNIIFGPLCDHIGRRKTLFIGFFIAMGGCLTSLFAPRVLWLVLGRCIQGVGIGANLVCLRAILRDVFEGKRLAQATTYLGILTAIIPPLAPITGGFIQSYTHNWRYNFVFLAGLLVILFANLALFLPETLKKAEDNQTIWRKTLKNAPTILRHQKFLCGSITAGLGLGSILTFIMMSTFLFQEVLHMTPHHFGLLSLVTAASMIVGGLINSRLLKHFDSEALIGVGAIFLVVGAFGVLLPGLFGLTSVVIVMIPICLMFMSTGFTFSNAFTMALTPFPSMAGTASACYGLLQGLTTATFTSIAALLPEHNQVPMGGLLLLIASIQVIIAYWLRHSSR